MNRYRKFFDADERASRAYMLFEFSQGFKEANRAVFVDTFTNYFFTKVHGESPGAEEVITPELLDALNRVHHAARAGRRLERRAGAEGVETSPPFAQGAA